MKKILIILLAGLILLTSNLAFVQSKADIASEVFSGTDPVDLSDTEIKAGLGVKTIATGLMSAIAVGTTEAIFTLPEKD